MIDAGILDGDYVVCRSETTAREGQIVVAGIPGEEATVKTFDTEGDQVVLIPSNPALEPMYFAADVGSNRLIKVLNGNPRHGITIDHPSTQRCR